MEEKDNNNEKIQSLRDMIYSAEKTLQGAKTMLLQLEGKKKVGRRKKIEEADDEGKKKILEKRKKLAEIFGEEQEGGFLGR